MASLRSRPCVHTESETERRRENKCECARERWGRRRKRESSRAYPTLSTRPRSLLALVNASCAFILKQIAPPAVAGGCTLLPPGLPPSCLTTLGQSCLPCCFAPLLCGDGGVLCEIVAVCNLQQMTLVVSTARDRVRAEAPAGGGGGAGAGAAVKEAAMLAASCVRACEGDASTATATAMRSNHRA